MCGRRNLRPAYGSQLHKRIQRMEADPHGGLEMMYKKQLTIALGALMSTGMLMAQAGGATQAAGQGTAQARGDTQVQTAPDGTQANAGRRHRRQMDPDKMADRLG